MKKIIIRTFFYALSILAANVIYSQDDVYKLERAGDLYDEHGFMKSKALSISGNLAISNSSGNVSYTYPLASYTRDGYPVNISLNYAGSVKYTTIDHFGTMGQGESDKRWHKMSCNKPTWMISVNNYVVQAFVQNSELILNQSYGSTTTSEQFVPKHWVIEGYDVCNNMKPFTATDHEGAGQQLRAFTDAIRILRADGSTLTLVKANNTDTPGGNTVNNWEDKKVWTGKYVEQGVNTKGVAYVDIG